MERDDFFLKTTACTIQVLSIELSTGKFMNEKCIPQKKLRTWMMKKKKKIWRKGRKTLEAQ